ncbi:TPA: hypothetical protein F7Z63_04330 [Legionella pneumophila]|nr:hypothetical protein [Legionella pneumophila]HAU1576125.1 hypothetical protein [Legionella pneumophila]HAU1682242.1 hypothetical protein [Legionella pneumophila]HAU3699809.1 hypothetical protein [Legionella pneumophila]
MPSLFKVTKHTDPVMLFIIFIISQARTMDERIFQDLLKPPISLLKKFLIRSFSLSKLPH